MQGSQATIIIAKLLMAIIDRLFKLLDRLRRDYLENRFRKQQLGFKKKSVSRSDKRQLEVAKRFKRSLLKRENNLNLKIKESQYKLDSYKLEMQRKLEDHNIEIKKAQRAYDIAKENYDINRKNTDYPKSKLEADKKNLAELQENINTKMDQKRNFETDVNKNLLEKDKDYKELLEKHKQLLDDIKLCDRAIDGFSSKFDKHMTESVRANFEEAIDRNIENTINDNITKDIDMNKDIKTIEDKIEHKKDEPKKDDNFMKEYLEKQRRKSLAKERQQVMER